MEMPQQVPHCVGIIIDGNRRWAEQQGLRIKKGHEKGIDLLKEFARWSYDAGVECVIAYVFSTENWHRSKEEVKNLMGFLRSLLKKKTAEAVEEGVRLRIIGQWDRFAPDIQELFTQAEEKTKKGMKGTLVFALSYGGRAEILSACKRACEERTHAEIAEMTEDDFARHLWTADNIPDPDLIIRTGGEQRLSNFLPWQSTYSEFFFTKTYWPAFTKEEFHSILDDFAHRHRRRGR